MISQSVEYAGSPASSVHFGASLMLSLSLPAGLGNLV